MSLSALTESLRLVPHAVALASSAQRSKYLADRGDAEPSSGRCHRVLEATRESPTTHHVTVGHLDPPGVSEGSKDLGPVFVARWFIPSDSTDLVVEPGRQSWAADCAVPRSTSTSSSRLS